MDCNNDGPISLLSNINKIIEQLMYTRLYNFLSIHNCIYDLQFGFRNKHSPNHALLSLTVDIRNALDNNSFAICVFIDLQKAFDTVDHEILLHKLELKIKIDGKRLFPSKYVKYLGILTDSYSNWSYHNDILASKLTRAIGMFSKIRHYTPKGTFHEIYYGIFSSILTYSCCQVWGQIQNKHINRILSAEYDRGL